MINPVDHRLGRFYGRLTQQALNTATAIIALTTIAHAQSGSGNTRLASGRPVGGGGGSAASGRVIVGSVNGGPAGVSTAGNTRVEGAAVFSSQQLAVLYAGSQSEVVDPVARQLKVGVRGGSGPSNGQIFYRLGGKPAFSSDTLSARDPDTLTYQLPAALLTIRGLEYYFEISRGAAKAFVGGPGSPYTFVTRLTDAAGPSLPDGAYRMIGFPFDVSPNAPASVFEDDLGAYNPAQWRLGRFNPQTGQYAEYPSVGNIARGRGYWLVARGSKQVDASGQSALPDTIVNAVRYATLTILPGWNQIAAPFAFNTVWGGRIAETGIENALWQYTSGFDSITSYTLAATLTPFSGYWVNNTSGAGRKLLLPYVEAAIQSASPKFVSDDSHGWTIALRAISGSSGDLNNYAGVAIGASNSADVYDFGEPPPFDRYISLAFIAGDSDGPVRTLAGDFRSPDERGWTFNVLIRGNTGSNVRLEIEPIADLPAGARVVLFDPSSQQQFDLLHNPSVVLPHQATEPGNEYKLIVGDREYQESQGAQSGGAPRSFALSQNYPNPFNSSSVIEFATPATAHVELTVFNVLGQPVAKLADGNVPAGIHQIVWEAQNDQRVPLPSGVYFLRLKTEGFVQTRKMVLLR